MATFLEGETRGLSNWLFDYLKLVLGNLGLCLQHQTAIPTASAILLNNVAGEMG